MVMWTNIPESQEAVQGFGHHVIQADFTRWWLILKTTENGMVTR